ncbi:MAG: hypothetical protein NTV97_26945 [Alphaproteobacteria bacterium]|nr:hypothetical protein [Alphaproteobacteria bacterium]
MSRRLPPAVKIAALPLAVAIIALAAYLFWRGAPPKSTEEASAPSTAERPRLPFSGGNTVPAISIALSCKAGAAEGTKGGWLRPVMELLLPGTAHADGWGAGKPINADAGRDIHIGTLDGYRYDFQAVGEFVGLKTGSFEIQMRLQPFGASRSVSVMTGIAIKLGGDVVAVYARPAAPVLINGKPTAPADKPIRLADGAEVTRQANGVVVHWPGKLEARLSHGDMLDSSVSVCLARDERTEGLLAADEARKPGSLVARDGTVVQLGTRSPADASDDLYRVFGNSWRIAQAQSLFDYAPGETVETFADRNFPYAPDPMANATEAQRKEAEAACRAAGVLDPAILRECILDIVATGKAELFAAAHASFAALRTLLMTEASARSGWSCEGPGGSIGWTCTIANRLGARVGSTMTLGIETLQAGKKTMETISCGPITPALGAACTDKTRGLMFQDANIVERFVLPSGDPVEVKSVGQCPDKKAANEPC